MLDHNSDSLVNQYLLATPSIQDPLFASSLVYICDHSEQGCMGLVINHTAEQSLGSILKQLDINTDHQTILDTPVFIGGPVKLEQGFVLHSGPDIWEKTLKIKNDIFLTSSKDILEAIAVLEGPSNFMVILGFSGWSAGQLEDELQSNSWLTAAANTETTFNTDIDKKWQLAFDTLGFNLNKLSPTTGNA